MSARRQGAPVGGFSLVFLVSLAALLAFPVLSDDAPSDRSLVVDSPAASTAGEAPAPGRLRIGGIWHDEQAGELVIFGENLRNGGDLSVTLEDHPLAVDRASSESWNPGMIRAGLTHFPPGDLLLAVRTGPLAQQYDTIRVSLGVEEETEELDSARSGMLNGSWQVLSTPYSNGDIHFEVVEDYTIDLRPYFLDYTRFSCPEACRKLTTGECRQNRCPRRLYYYDENGANTFRNILNTWGPLETDFIKMQRGVLTIKKGYRWDGPSIPKWLPYAAQDYRRWNRASAVHDVIYDLMRDGILPKPESNDWLFPLLNSYNNRLAADLLIYMLTREDGQPAFAANVGYALVRLGGYQKLDETNPGWKRHAVAEVGQRVSCAPRGGLDVTLDSTGSRFSSFTRWSDNGQPIPGAQNMNTPQATLTPGLHKIRLEVNSSSPEPVWQHAEFSIHVTADETDPVGMITAPPGGICLAGPVVVRDSFSDECDECLERSYSPGPGPVYVDQGDYHVSLSVADDSGNSVTDSVLFTIDRIAPAVDLVYPPPSARLPSIVPFSLLFSTSDQDGASGDVLHEIVTLDDCVIYDGWHYGETPNGLLSDDPLTVSVDELCRITETCGLTTLEDPTIRVEATDCAGNIGADEVTLSGSMMLRPGICGFPPEPGTKGQELGAPRSPAAKGRNSSIGSSKGVRVDRGAELRALYWWLGIESLGP